MTRLELEDKLRRLGVKGPKQFPGVLHLIDEYVAGVIGEDEKPSKVFVPKERGLGEALDADPRNNLRAEQRRRAGIGEK